MLESLQLFRAAIARETTSKIIVQLLHKNCVQ